VKISQNSEKTTTRNKTDLQKKNLFSSFFNWLTKSNHISGEKKRFNKKGITLFPLSSVVQSS